MARWKARGRLYICRNWTFFAISYGWDVISENVSKSAFFEGGWVTLSADFRGKGRRPPTTLGTIVAEWLQSLSYDIKISALRHLVLSQCTRVTDGQTDRRTDRITTPKTALAYARAVKSCWRWFDWTVGSTVRVFSSEHTAAFTAVLNVGC